VQAVSSSLPLGLSGNRSGLSGYRQLGKKRHNEEFDVFSNLN
jgi:hypothetical protein